MARKLESTDQPKQSNRVNLFLTEKLHRSLEEVAAAHDEKLPQLIKRYLAHGLSADEFASHTPAGQRMVIVFRYEDIPKEDKDSFTWPMPSDRTF